MNIEKELKIIVKAIIKKPKIFKLSIIGMLSGFSNGVTLDLKENMTPEEFLEEQFMKIDWEETPAHLPELRDVSPIRGKGKFKTNVISIYELNPNIMLSVRKTDDEVYLEVGEENADIYNNWIYIIRINDLVYLLPDVKICSAGDPDGLINRELISTTDALELGFRNALIV